MASKVKIPRLTVISCLLGSVLLVPTVTGCSYIFVSTPSTPSGGGMERANDCTSSKVAPVLDTVFGTLEVARTAVAVGNDDGDYVDQPLSREADIGFGVGFTALFLSSAVYGYYFTSRCHDLREHGPASWSPDDDADSDAAPRHAPPAARTTIKHPGADEPEPASKPADGAAQEVAPGTEDAAKGGP